MEKCICLYKPVGATPLQLINHFRKLYPEYERVTLGYAGRLDPMADGLLLLLAGDENKKRKIYENFPKVYECKILFGISTDTYDLLGKILDNQNIQKPLLNSVQKIIPSFMGKHTQPYPPYSSQPVHGKPLYYWARNNKLEDVLIPTKDIEIYGIDLLDNTEITAHNLEKTIRNRINKVIGDFRQDEILALWKQFFSRQKQLTFPIFSFRISCSSGTYIRSFANNLGKALGIPSLALSITRTQIGTYNLQDCIKIDTL